MENVEKALLEKIHQRDMKLMINEIRNLTSLLE
jgi:hypothetical protein